MEQRVLPCFLMIIQLNTRMKSFLWWIWTFFLFGLEVFVGLKEAEGLVTSLYILWLCLESSLQNVGKLISYCLFWIFSRNSETTGKVPLYYSSIQLHIFRSSKELEKCSTYLQTIQFQKTTLGNQKQNNISFGQYNSISLNSHL